VVQFYFFSVPTRSGFNSQLPKCFYTSLQKRFLEDTGNVGLGIAAVKSLKRLQLKIFLA